jgi:hypothetical protein
MLENSLEYGSHMSHAVARDFATFIRTMNMGSQVFAEDATNTDVQTSATTVQAVLNGVPFVMAKDDALDISADTQLGVWTLGDTYTALHMQYVVNPSSGNKVYYKCILGHTATLANKPDENNLREDATWKTYWVRSTQTAEAASGAVVATLHSAYFLCLATSDGVLTMVKAGDVALDGDEKLVIPNFEAEMFVAIGVLHINSPVGGFILGSTDIDTGTVGTFTQLIGPQFAQGKEIDQN